MLHCMLILLQGGPPLSAKPVPSSDVDFFIHNDMVTIADTKLARRYGEYFIRHITKFEEIIQAAQPHA
jgi:translation initiation factor 3 subunit L